MRVGLWSFREIVLSDTGISFRRRCPITIQKITNLSLLGRATTKKPEWGLKIEGLTLESKKVTIKVMRRFGLAKRWQG